MMLGFRKLNDEELDLFEQQLLRKDRVHNSLLTIDPLQLYVAFSVDKDAKFFQAILTRRQPGYIHIFYVGATKRLTYGEHIDKGGAYHAGKYGADEHNGARAERIALARAFEAIPIELIA